MELLSGDFGPLGHPPDAWSTLRCTYDSDFVLAPRTTVATVRGALIKPFCSFLSFSLSLSLSLSLSRSLERDISFSFVRYQLSIFLFGKYKR